VGGASADSLPKEQTDRPPTPDPSPPRARARGGRGVSRAVLARPDDEFCFLIRISNSGCTSAFSRRDFARALRCPSQRREQGMPDARCTRGLVCKDVRKKTHTSIQVQRRHSGIPCAMALRLTSSSPRRIGFCCLRRLRIAGSSAPGRADLPFRRLDANHEAPGPHDFTVRFGTARQHAL
jgi:hypothetical protein